MPSTRQWSRKWYFAALAAVFIISVVYLHRSAKVRVLSEPVWTQKAGSHTTNDDDDSADSGPAEQELGATAADQNPTGSLPDTSDATALLDAVTESSMSASALTIASPSASTDVKDADTTMPAIQTGPSKAIVIGRLDSENSDWVSELPDWQHHVYVVDLPAGTNSSTGLRTQRNKAHEATPYLTYIIDNYPDFPDVSAFVHYHGHTGPEKSWHIDALGNNPVSMLSTLRLDTVLRRGYVNLRCQHYPGCPEEIRPFRTPPRAERHAEHVFAFYYAGLFNISLAQVRETVDVVATPCCAQFAVSAERLRARPKSDYEHFRQFLWDTPEDGEDDETAGRVMEYMWHILFGEDHVFCPDKFRCHCDVYGNFCDLAVAPPGAGRPLPVGLRPGPGGLRPVPKGNGG